MKVLLQAFNSLVHDTVHSIHVHTHTHTQSAESEERGFPRDCSFSNRRHLQVFHLIRPPLFPLSQLCTITEGGIQVKLCEITVTAHANSPQPTHNGTCQSRTLSPAFCIGVPMCLIKMNLFLGAIRTLK